MQYNLEGKTFTSLSNTGSGEVGGDTLFHYHQDEEIVWADYAGGAIVKGHLIARVIEGGTLDMRYHHVNTDGEIMIGKCLSTPGLSDDGRLLFNEAWQCLSGDLSSGSSVIIEVDGAASVE